MALGIYIHVPFCAARCGYCDFNTYVPDGEARIDEYIEAAVREIDLARRELGERSVDTVFFGGGTPTLIGAGRLLKLLEAVKQAFLLAAEVEVTTEANPESVNLAMLTELRRGGFGRVSLGMQSASEHVLRTLDRKHTPGGAADAAQLAHAAGFEHVSLDLIYGTPGESDEDWRASVEAALATKPDHISAYALAIKPGTPLAAQVRRGLLPAPDDAIQAHRYELVDALLERAGFQWYELCSWATSEAARCRHNLGYWRSDDWWGIGPGAHSHVDGVRWSNVLHPSAYAKRLASGQSPAGEREVLSTDERAVEQVILRLRTREGLPLSALTAEGRTAANEQAEHGLLELTGDRARLTTAGRQLSDTVTSALLL